MSSFPRTNRQPQGQHLGAWLRAGNPAGPAPGGFYLLGGGSMGVAAIKAKKGGPSAGAAGDFYPLPTNRPFAGAGADARLTH